MIITVADRFAALRMQESLWGTHPAIARAICEARYAESFPASYSAQAVDLSRRTIKAAAAAAGNLIAGAADLHQLAGAINALHDAPAGWYA